MANHRITPGRTVDVMVRLPEALTRRLIAALKKRDGKLRHGAKSRELRRIIEEGVARFEGMGSRDQLRELRDRMKHVSPLLHTIQRGLDSVLVDVGLALKELR